MTEALAREGLESLLARVREASGPDRELDLAIWNATNQHPSQWHPSFPSQTVVEHNKYGKGAVGNPVYELGAFTASVDAALALVDRCFPFGPGVGHEMTGSLARDGEECFNFRIRIYSDEEGEAPTTHWATSYTSYPLAIVEALLTALIAQGAPS